MGVPARSRRTSSLAQQLFPVNQARAYRAVLRVPGVMMFEATRRLRGEEADRVRRRGREMT
jgi:hypothetical protein